MFEDQAGHESGELIDARLRAGFVDVNELVGGEAEDLADVVAASPRREEVGDPCQRVTAVLEPPDEVEATKVTEAINPDSSGPAGSMQQRHRLVLADGPHRNAAALGELVDCPGLVVGGRRNSVGCLLCHASTLPSFTVTVNTVTISIDPDRVSDRLLSVWPDASVGEARVLTGGFWASMFRVAITGQPGGVADEVVVRFAPDASMGAKEAEVQRAVAAAGFPTPALHVSRPDPETGGWWSVMDYVAGRPLLAGLDGLRVLRHAPSLVRTLPRQLAETMAALHRIDPTPIETAIRAVAPDVALSTGDVIDHLLTGADAAGRADVARALEHLASHISEPQSVVVCHGDFHPFNVVDAAGRRVVLDWTGAIVADPCYDVAFTEFLLANPPLGLPRPLAKLGRATGGMLARRFVAEYAHINPDVDVARRGWYRALHCARIIIDAGAGHEGPGHPWAQLVSPAARELSAATNTHVEP